MNVRYSWRTKSVSFSKYGLSNSLCNRSFQLFSIRTSISIKKTFRKNFLQSYKYFLLLPRIWPRSLVNRTSDSGSEGHRFESCRGHYEKAPCKSMLLQGAFFTSFFDRQPATATRSRPPFGGQKRHPRHGQGDTRPAPITCDNGSTRQDGRNGLLADGDRPATGTRCGFRRNCPRWVRHRPWCRDVAKDSGNYRLLV